MLYRPFTELDFEALQALDLEQLQLEYPHFDSLEEPEKQGRIRTSLPALKFYERSEHSFVAEKDDVLYGAIFAQSVWQGDRPSVLVSRLWVREENLEVARGLLRACAKSTYDAAVYEIHAPFPKKWLELGTLEEFKAQGLYGVRLMGGRSRGGPGVPLLEF